MDRADHGEDDSGQYPALEKGFVAMSWWHDTCYKIGGFYLDIWYLL